MKIFIQSQFAMRKVALLYNPLSGRRRDRRLKDVEAVVAVLRDAGVEVLTSATLGPAETGAQARDAVNQGCDTVFACGGDGTIHDVLQGMVGRRGTLGIIPLGTANSLACDLGIPLEPASAARAALSAEARRFAAGKIKCRGLDGSPVSRYFTVTAGIGGDAELFYRLAPQTKQRFGMTAYVFHGLYLWLTLAMRYFEVVFPDDSRERVTGLLAVRITEFGNVLRKLAPGAALEHNCLRLVLFRTSSRWRYMQYAVRGLLRHDWHVPGVGLLDAKQFSCCPLPQQDQRHIYVEADGELLGTLPADITIVPDAFSLLVPQDFATARIKPKSVMNYSGVQPSET
jgi:YegS/Rv2252/BmrU family lipid kinase